MAPKAQPGSNHAANPTLGNSIPLHEHAKASSPTPGSPKIESLPLYQQNNLRASRASLHAAHGVMPRGISRPDTAYDPGSNLAALAAHYQGEHPTASAPPYKTKFQRIRGFSDQETTQAILNSTRPVTVATNPASPSGLGMYSPPATATRAVHTAIGGSRAEAQQQQQQHYSPTSSKQQQQPADVTTPAVATATTTTVPLTTTASTASIALGATAAGFRLIGSLKHVSSLPALPDSTIDPAAMSSAELSRAASMASNHIHHLVHKHHSNSFHRIAPNPTHTINANATTAPGSKPCTPDPAAEARAWSPNPDGGELGQRSTPLAHQHSRQLHGSGAAAAGVPLTKGAASYGGGAHTDHTKTAFTKDAKKRDMPGGKGGIFQELLQATRKAFATGMGEWDLQALEWSHPEFKQHLLQGPLGPETLRHQYGLHDGDILRLYRVMYLYTVGFCTAVLEPTEHAQKREVLLETIFKTYTQLWDEAVGVCFHSEMVSALKNKTDAVQSMHDMAEQLDMVRTENMQLQTRLNEFVRDNIDNMLSFRLLKDRSASSEGEAAMLAHANDQLSIKLAGAEIKVQSLIHQAETANEKEEEAQARIRECEAVITKLKEALQDQQATMSQQYFNIVELEKAVANANRDKAAAVNQIIELESRAATSARSSTDVERQLADQTRAYQLLHADFLVKKHELEELRSANAVLVEKEKIMHDTHVTATQKIETAQREASNMQCKWEHDREYLRRLEAMNKKLASRNQDLVKSYWPFMVRLRDAETANQALLSEAEALRAQRKSDLAELAAVRQQLQKQEELQRRLAAMEQELSIEEVQISDAALEALHPDAAQARAFVRLSKQRIKDLTDQLVRLVDVHAGASAKLKRAVLTEAELRKKVKALEGLIKSTEEHYMKHMTRYTAAQRISTDGSAAGTSSYPGSPNAAAVPAGTIGASSPAAGGQQQQLAELSSKLLVSEAAVADGERRIKELEEVIEGLQAQLQSRDHWLAGISQQAALLATQCEELLLRDPDAPQPLGLFPEPAAPEAGPDANGEQGAAGQPVAAAAAAAVATAATTAASPAPPSTATTPSTPTAAAATAVNTSTVDCSSSSSADATAAAAAATDDQDDQPTPVEMLRAVASGRLAHAVQSLAETEPALVKLDWRWDGMMDALQRLMDWSGMLLDSKLMVAHQCNLHERLAAAVAQLATATQEVSELHAKLQESQAQHAAAEKQQQATAVVAERNSQQAAEAQAACSELQTALQSAQEQVEALTQQQVLMEEEYGNVKLKLLELEMTAGDRQAAHDRALADAARALQKMRLLERETEEHRAMRVQLEADIIGCKAWVRTMEEMERSYRALLSELGGVRDQRDAQTLTVRELQDRLLALEAEGAGRAAEAKGAGEQCQLLQRELVSVQEQQAVALAVLRQAHDADMAAGEARCEGLKQALELQTSQRKSLEAQLESSEAALTALFLEQQQLQSRLLSLTQEKHATARVLAELAANGQAMQSAMESMERRLGSLQAATSDAAVVSGGGTLNVPLISLMEQADSLLDMMQQFAVDSKAGELIAVVESFEAFVRSVMAAVPSVMQAASGHGTSLLLTSGSTNQLEHEKAQLQQLLATARQEAAAAISQLASTRGGAQQSQSRAEALLKLAAREEQRAVQTGALLQQLQRLLDAKQQELLEAKQQVSVLSSEHSQTVRKLARQELEAKMALERTATAETRLQAEQAALAGVRKRLADLERAAASSSSSSSAPGAGAAASSSGTSPIAELAGARMQVVAAQAAERQAVAVLEGVQRQAARVAAEAAAARQAAAEAVSEARRLEQAMLEMTSALADARRHEEATRDLLRHAQADKAALQQSLERLRQELHEAGQHSDGLQQQLWSLQLTAQHKDVEKKLVLDELVDTRFGTSATHPPTDQPTTNNR